MKNLLKPYNDKRDFTQTKEPQGKISPSKNFRFVIQKHDATRLHYDFRFEHDGVLKSWAVSKGLPYKNEDKNLAMHVEDHPLSYFDFEGNIPEGNYGQVM
jgi:bifunctional non-homologous end joining protein LigD